MGKAMRQVTNLTQILEDHQLWVSGKGGTRAYLSGVDLRGVDLSGADLSYADLYDARLRHADLRGTKLRGADLRYADLSGATLRIANLIGVSLRGADLSGANLRDADLCGAVLRHARLRNADLSGADLSGADLLGADLRNAGLIVLPLPIWDAYVHRETVRIGCQHHSHADWRQLADGEIDQMDKNALPWWRAHKSTIFAAMDAVAGKQENLNE